MHAEIGPGGSVEWRATAYACGVGCNIVFHSRHEAGELIIVLVQ